MTLANEQPSTRRVTVADLEAQVKSEYYFSAADGMQHSEQIPEHGGEWEMLEHVTICVLILHNGLKLVGVNTGCVDPRNFSPTRAREMARKEAIDQLWPMLGYQLKNDLYMEAEMDDMVQSGAMLVQSAGRGTIHDMMDKVDADVREITGMPVNRDANLNEQTARKMEQKWPTPPLEIDEGVRVHNENPPI